MKQEYKPTVGLEIHVELKTKTKMFCSCPNETWKIGVEDQTPNNAVCPICLGHPGTLPVANKEAIIAVIKTGLALNCQIAVKAKFDRKNYFYPDLPKGYQISQYDQPLCENGYLDIGSHKINITRIHLEEDTGKLTHNKNVDYSLIDFDRAGVPLMELVTEPDIESSQEAKEFCQELQNILRTLNVSDADMEKGQMRCEVNISVSKNKKQLTKLKKDELGTKVEIKNLNSFRSVERAIDYEIKRQTKVLEQGEKVIQETRGWNDIKQETFSQRAKEGSADYRYFPEPDLPPIILTTNNQKPTTDNVINIEEIRRSLPELPNEKRQRFINEYGFAQADAKILTNTQHLGDYTEQVMSELKQWLNEAGEFEGEAEEIWEKNKEKLTKLVAGWLVNKLGGLLAARKLSYSQHQITAENFAEFINMIFSRKVSTKNANVLLEKMLETGEDPCHLLEEHDLKASVDFDLDKIIEEVINKNPEQVKEFKAGKIVLLKFFLGQVMKDSKGKADPKESENLLIQKLS